MTGAGRSRTTHSASEPSDPQTGDRWVDARGWLWTYDAEDLGGGWTHRFTTPDDASQAPGGALEDWLVRYTDWTPDDDWREYNPPASVLPDDASGPTS